MIIGLCGKSCSGKSTFANNLNNELNGKVCILDIDEVGHRSLLDEYAKKKLVECFGNEIIENGSICRKKIADIVFNDKDAMNKLTDITWEFMEREIDEYIEKNKEKIIVLDWQLLPKTKFFEMCDIKVLLDVPYEVRKKRALIRDRITEEKFDERESASLDVSDYSFDFILNNTNIKSVRKLVKQI